MSWLKFLAGLAVIGIALAVVGALVQLGELLSELDAVIVLVLAVAIMVAVGLLGTSRRRWLSNPYW